MEWLLILVIHVNGFADISTVRVFKTESECFKAIEEFVNPKEDFMFCSKNLKKKDKK